MGANQHTSAARTAKFQLRLTPDEKAALEARAAAEGVALAEMIRRALGLAEAPRMRVGGEPELTDRYGTPAAHLLDTIERDRQRRK